MSGRHDRPRLSRSPSIRTTGLTPCIRSSPSRFPSPSRPNPRMPVTVERPAPPHDRVTSAGLSTAACRREPNVGLPTAPPRRGARSRVWPMNTVLAARAERYGRRRGCHKLRPPDPASGRRPIRDYYQRRTGVPKRRAALGLPAFTPGARGTADTRSRARSSDPTLRTNPRGGSVDTPTNVRRPTATMAEPGPLVPAIRQQSERGVDGCALPGGMGRPQHRRQAA